MIQVNKIINVFNKIIHYIIDFRYVKRKSIIVCTTMYTDDESIHFSRLKGYGINMSLYGEYVCIATIVVAYIYIYSHAVPIEFDNPDV